MSNRAGLEDAFRATSYIVSAPGGPILLRIGEKSPELDRLLAEYRVTEWAFITAYNPGSFQLPPRENERNNADLLERLQQHGYEVVPGEGVGDDGAWPPEQSFLVIGVDHDGAAAFGRWYRQRAVVVGCVGGVVHLIWC